MKQKNEPQKVRNQNKTKKEKIIKKQTMKERTNNNKSQTRQ